MILDMPKTVEVKSVWYVVSMKWISNWQKYVGFDTKSNGIKPAKIDNSDLIQEYYTHPQTQQKLSVYLFEQTEKLSFTNVQLKSGLKEGEDYMLVDERLHAFWK